MFRKTSNLIRTTIILQEKPKFSLENFKLDKVVEKVGKVGRMAVKSLFNSLKRGPSGGSLNSSSVNFTSIMYELGCALTFASEAKFEIEAKISFRLEAKKKPDFT